MNKEIRNEGTEEDPHPVEEFWAERFIIYPNDCSSGPVRKGARSDQNQASWKRHETATEETTNKAGRFSIEGLNGAYISFGGGLGKCPGRHFAEQEVILTLALFVQRFDIELRTAEEWKPRMDTDFFPFGALPPSDPVPFRIRLRGTNVSN